MNMISIDVALKSAQWLAENKDADNIIVLDATVAPVQPNTKTSAVSHFTIPGAIRFDYDKKICDLNSSLPHMMPSSEQFQQQVRDLGINHDSVVIVYDTVGVYSSPRAWWMFRAMGHTQVAVLDGGLPAWQEAGFETVAIETAAFPESSHAGNFISRAQENFFCDAATTLSGLDDSNCTVLDARSAGRFEGRDPEPRPGLRCGHMPNAKNLPFPEVVEGYFMKSPQQLKQIFANTMDQNNRLIFTCGSGLTACILTLAAQLAGYSDLSVYDGSWCEWGLPGELPVV